MLLPTAPMVPDVCVPCLIEGESLSHFVLSGGSIPSSHPQYPLMIIENR
jgi:hypothetical protein